MINVTDIISYVIAIIGCAIGVSGYFASINARASKNGRLIERIDSMYNSLEGLKAEIKENTKGVDRVLDNHTERIIKLEDAVRELDRLVRGNNNNA